MKLVWKNQANGGEGGGKKRSRSQSISLNPILPFGAEEEERGGEDGRNSDGPKSLAIGSREDDPRKLAESFESQGNLLAENGRYCEALGKWEAALTLMPENAILHEQKAQVLLEIGDAWNALKAATRATELEPSWLEAWITLGRAQLNFGEPDSAIESFDRALAIKPGCEEVRIDRGSALHLIRKRKQLHSSGLSTANTRFKVGDNSETS
ncbi:tetratricopeptide repeat protein 33 isoform X1 [Phoenix dactylifera]|uniref:Tetratricopeptide repeat protein 33 isoform X1 n=1 Tax=Phoenix dactylifera TaxID=42345 RepID=A0A8B7BMN4_PHODC|nr:tetratricopeptide repeat protein 33 isoform X1 [Phoenix dactylifera]